MQHFLRELLYHLLAFKQLIHSIHFLMLAHYWFYLKVSVQGFQTTECFFCRWSLYDLLTETWRLQFSSHPTNNNHWVRACSGSDNTSQLPSGRRWYKMPSIVRCIWTSEMLKYKKMWVLAPMKENSLDTIHPSLQVLLKEWWRVFLLY